MAGVWEQGRRSWVAGVDLGGGGRIRGGWWVGKGQAYVASVRYYGSGDFGKRCEHCAHDGAGEGAVD